MHPDFRLPSPGSIKGRSSSITAAFFQAITPVVIPTRDEIDEALRVLGMSSGACRCAYCGDRHTEWDHFRPTVIGRKPTGYITEIANLVPACGKCNQSKGNRPWRAWMLGTSPRSPTSRGVADIEQRIERLTRFEGWRAPVCVDYETLLGAEQWQAYLRHLDQAVAHLNDAQALAMVLRRAVSDAPGTRRELT